MKKFLRLKTQLNKHQQMVPIWNPNEQNTITRRVFSIIYKQI